ncbi:multicomponent Na+:H+ antiporter subunit F [Ectothiorhodosinus mongolicus]|uniref:Multicomponent Na+:H+ antiporter subunit F n=1 Tax=Ectothiorhodosinus mongolicus TaxID=233100 RepID=A0A1R3W7G5_9GAMM|nr:monovalent cation/H+ antiporter complex subunit F [Ectothiorhodosinus mongolicus]ULX57413.1 pH regulation protein F [Ectothiorhodosinus mongolicus]SIT72058.1 multicomponent Na+:H+ antiporter subunit F [Ectothiorhodosinus mongolicus]
MLEISITIAYFIISLALLLSFVRLVIGPSLPDRVVALEMIATITIGYIAVYTLSSGKTAFLDVAMVLALTAFLAAVGFARLVTKGGGAHVD